MNIKLDANTIRCINAFEKITGAEVQDCIIDGGSAYFVVEEGKVGLVIGKSGKTIRKVQDTIGKRVRVFEFSESLEHFVKNIIAAPIDNFKEEGGVVTVTISKNKKAAVIGRDGKNLSLLVQILKRNFPVTDLQIQ